VRGESHNVSAVAHYYTLPDTPYNLWLRDELAEQLHLPNDGTRVEVVGGEMVVSPGPTYDHNLIVQDVQEALIVAKRTDPGFRWRCVHTMDLNLSEIRDGYIRISSSWTSIPPTRRARPRPGICFPIKCGWSSRSRHGRTPPTTVNPP
jgi:hypothetical protein